MASLADRASSSDSGARAGSGSSDITAGWVSLLTGLSVSAFLYWRNHANTAAWPHMSFFEFNMVNTALILGVPLMVVLIALQREPAEFGLTVGDSRKGNLWALVLFGLFLPAIIYFASQAGSQHYYVRWMHESGALQGVYWNGHSYDTRSGFISWPYVATHQVVMAFYMFGWEWYHRGFLLNGLRKIMPVAWAVVLQAFLFGALHYGKPPIELASSFAGGILLGIMAVRFKSFVPCFLIHMLVSAANDFAVLYFVFRH